MRKWMLVLGTCGTLATGATAVTGGVGGSDNYCAWDNNAAVECTTVQYENEGLAGEVAEDDELVIDMGDIVVECDMEF